MKREWHKWHSPRLGREMELLVFGHSGLPVIVFPTSCGRFFEFEERGMVQAVEGAIERGELQLVCVDSVDDESWYNRDVPPRWRIARQVQYEGYVMEEVLPLVRALGNLERPATAGASFGGYHAANFALRHPWVFRGFLSMGAAFDLSNFMGGYYDEDVYFNLPPHYMAGLEDWGLLEQHRRNSYVLVAGEWDICRGQTERMAQVLRDKGIPVRFDLWGDHSLHDWPEWRRMVAAYL